MERFRRPAAKLGPNWLEITTGRARTDEEEVGGAQEERARGAEHRAPGEAFSLMTQADLVCGGWR